MTIIRHSLFVSFLIMGILPIFCVDAQVAEGVRVSYAFAAPLNSADPDLIVTYTAVGDKAYLFNAPGDNSFPLFRGISMDVNGQSGKYLVGGNDADQVIFDNQVRITRDTPYSFRIRCKALWRLPLRWELVAMNPTGSHYPYDLETGNPALLNAEEVFYFNKTKKVVNGVPEFSVDRVFPPKADLSVSISKRSTPEKPTISVSYKNTGKGNWVLEMPVRSELPFYHGFTLVADGVECKLRAHESGVCPCYIAFKNSRSVDPEERAAFDVPLDGTWVLPDRWDKLELKPTGMHAPANAIGMAAISGPNQFTFMRKDFSKRED